MGVTTPKKIKMEFDMFKHLKKVIRDLRAKYVASHGTDMVIYRELLSAENMMLLLFGVTPRYSDSKIIWKNSPKFKFGGL